MFLDSNPNRNKYSLNEGMNGPLCGIIMSLLTFKQNQSIDHRHRVF
jgi:hypothetical protein